MHIQQMSFFLCGSLRHMQQMPFFLCGTLMHMQQMSLGLPDACPANVAKNCFFLSAALSHIQPTLEKTPADDLDNDILLLRSHLVIAGKTQSAPENIGSNILKIA